jgi:hypothetical protein
MPGLAHPGGDIAGNTILGPDISAKRIQLAQELVPTVTRVAFLWNPNNASHVTYHQELKPRHRRSVGESGSARQWLRGYRWRRTAMRAKMAHKFEDRETISCTRLSSSRS